MTLTGTQLEEVAREAADWYYDSVETLVKALEEDFPYGNVKLTPAEQMQQYLAMTPEGWQVLFASLERRYRGMPNSSQKIEEAATRYVKRMETIRSQFGSVIPSSEEVAGKAASGA